MNGDLEEDVQEIHIMSVTSRARRQKILDRLVGSQRPTVLSILAPLEQQEEVLDALSEAVQVANNKADLAENASYLLRKKESYQAEAMAAVEPSEDEEQ